MENKKQIFRQRYPSDIQELVENGIEGKVQPQDNGCILWTGMVWSHTPMLTVRHNGKRVTVSVRKYLAMKGSPNKLFPHRVSMIAKCGNERCVNPEHFIQATVSSETLIVKLRMFKLYQELKGEKCMIKKLGDLTGLSYQTVWNYTNDFRVNEQLWINLERNTSEEN